MTNRINVVNMDTVSKRLLSYLLVGFLGVTGIIGVKSCGAYYEFKNYSDRINVVKECMSKGDVEKARSILETYSRENALEKGDVEKLKLDIDVCAIDLAKQTELNKKAAKLAPLEKLIAEENFEKAFNLFQTLKIEGIINPEAESSYLEIINNFSLDKLLARVATSVSLEDKIKIAERILSNYPNCEKASELRMIQADSYLKIAESYFKTDVDERRTIDFLARFNEWLRKQDPAFVKSTDFSNFLLEGEGYILRRINKEANDLNIEIGDRVKIVKNLGPVRGNTNSEYFCGGSINEVPLFSEGIVCGGADGEFWVNLDDGRHQWKLVRRELEKISSSNETPLVYQQFNLIKEYINNPGGKK